ncbi:MAG: ribosome small subunit-dependent GTPase A [Myxococcaceae bacterium]|nr:ribosome small subunit-dependent GTPase A [Myxococcaceae bacterium]MCI0670606.1 ribosome small subunit-dependent GTPase A [Myxococcaceae bacterium]
MKDSETGAPSRALEALGWTPTLAEALAALRAPELVVARALEERGGFYSLASAEGELSARVAGALRHQASSAAELPVVGDWVAVRRGDSGGLASIRAVLPRRSKLSRRAAGEEHVEQVLAANVDVAFLVMGLDGDYNLRRLERYLALARTGGVRPVVVLSKADLRPDASECVAEVEAATPGVAVHAANLRSPECDATLLAHVRTGETAVLLGSSGVGKSTLLNRLLGQEAQRTREVRADDSRGRHTTSHRQLFRLTGGALLIDTPGVRELHPWEALPTVEEAFPDVLELTAACRFRDCRHEDEPGCAVRSAVVDGVLQAERLTAFRKLRGELEVAQSPKGAGDTSRKTGYRKARR